MTPADAFNERAETMDEAAAQLPATVRGRKNPPIVLLHGFGANRSSWVSMIGALSQLRRTVALDLPGHGEAVAWPQVPDVSACAKAVTANLKTMPHGPVTLIGHSMGGAVATLIGLMRPDLVARLILLAPGGFGPQMNVRLLRRYAHMEGRREIELVLEQFFAPTSRVPEALVEALAEERADARLRRSLAAIVEVIVRGEGQGTLPLDKLAAAPFPTTLVWGEEDQVLPLTQAIAAPAIIARHILPGVGHMPHLEAEATVLRIVEHAVLGRTHG